MIQPLPQQPPVPVSDAELEGCLALAHRLADAAGAACLPHFRAPLEIANKAGEGGYDPVTVADRAAETAIRRLVEAARPEDGIFGEEQGHRPGSSGLTWVIDPIDGTRAFITGMPLWGTLIGLYDGERPVLGLMDQPYLRERAWGSRKGAWMRGPSGDAPLHTRRCGSLAEAVLMTTHPGLLETPADRAAFVAVEHRVRLSRYGGDCYAYLMLAHGFVDLVIESGLKPYDVQALIPIVEAAGGRMTAWDGGTAAQGGRVIAAGDPALLPAAMAALSGGA